MQDRRERYHQATQRVYHYGRHHSFARTSQDPQPLGERKDGRDPNRVQKMRDEMDEAGEARLGELVVSIEGLRTAVIFERTNECRRDRFHLDLSLSEGESGLRDHRQARPQSAHGIVAQRPPGP